MLKIERFYRYGKFDISEADFQLWNTDSDKREWLGEIIDRSFYHPENNVYLYCIKITIEIEETMIHDEQNTT